MKVLQRAGPLLHDRSDLRTPFRVPFRAPEDLEHLLDGLRKAG